MKTDAIREAASEGRRSKLYRWMEDNFEKFSQDVREAGRPNWKALASAFGQLGLTDRNNSTPTPEGARRTWLKVRQYRQHRAADRPPEAILLPSVVHAAVVETEPEEEFHFRTLSRPE